MKAVTSNETRSDDHELQNLRIQHIQWLGSGDETEWARSGGTQLIVDWTMTIGAFPSHNWTRSRIPNVDGLNIDAFEFGHQRPNSCYNEALAYIMVACDFITYNYECVVEWLNKFGYEIIVDDLKTVGERGDSPDYSICVRNSSTKMTASQND